jgi:hypothetical protein
MIKVLRNRGTRGQEPCPKEKQADRLQAICLFFFFFGVPQKGLVNHVGTIDLSLVHPKKRSLK